MKRIDIAVVFLVLRSLTNPAPCLAEARIPPILDGSRVVLEPYGVAEGSVADPNGGYVLVRFDPSFSGAYMIESVSFRSLTRNGVPAVFASVSVCGATPTGRPDLSNPLFVVAPFVGSANGPNEVPMGLHVDPTGMPVYVAIKFPTRGGTYPDDHPAIPFDLLDLERGYFSATYLVSPSGEQRQFDYGNAIVSMTCRADDPVRGRANAPINLSANRIRGDVDFTFTIATNAGEGSRQPAVGFEVLRRSDTGPWQVVASLDPGRMGFTINSPPNGRQRWAVRSIGPFGNRSELSNVEITSPFTAVSPITAWGPEEPNGSLAEALPVTLPIERSEDASIFPTGDRDFYSFAVHPGDLVRIWAGPSGGFFTGLDTLDLAATLFDERGRVLAEDDNSLDGKYPLIDYMVPGGSATETKQLVVELFDPRGSELRPGSVHQPASNKAYWYHIEAFPTLSVTAQPSPGTLNRTDERISSHPTSGGMVFEVRFDAGSVHRQALRIFDVRGRLVRTLVPRGTSRVQALEWSGDTDDGRRAGAGVYFGAMSLGERRLTTKFVLTK